MEQVMINSTGNSTEYEWMELIQSPVNVQHQQQQHSYAVMLASGVVETAASGANNMSNSMIPTQTSTSASGRRAAQQQPVSENKQKSSSTKKRRTTNASFSIKPRVSSSGSQVSSIKRSKSTGSVTLNMSGASASGAGSNRAPGPSHRGSGGGGSNYHGHHHRHHPNSVKRHHTCHNSASASSTALNAEQRWRSSAARLIARSRHNRIASPVDADFIDEDDQFVCFKSL